MRSRKLFRGVRAAENRSELHLKVNRSLFPAASLGRRPAVRFKLSPWARQIIILLPLLCTSFYRRNLRLRSSLGSVNHLTLQSTAMALMAAVQKIPVTRLKLNFLLVKIWYTIYSELDACLSQYSIRRVSKPSSLMNFTKLFPFQ